MNFIEKIINTLWDIKTGTLHLNVIEHENNVHLIFLCKSELPNHGVKYDVVVSINGNQTLLPLLLELENYDLLSEKGEYTVVKIKK